MKSISIIVVTFLLAIFLSTCDNGIRDLNGGDTDTSNIDINEIPKFVEVNYIELEKISRISKFRSAVGHNYSDDFETCRSMKHYFQPGDDVDWSSVLIFSPVNGMVSQVDEEWAGTQIRIKSIDYPSIIFILFHVNLINPLNTGDQIFPGQQLGNHIGAQTMSDIAVGISIRNGWKLVSYFDVITDSLFQDYQARGLDSRNDVIITRETRDNDPLTCDGEEFTNIGNLENWVILN